MDIELIADAQATMDPQDVEAENSAKDFKGCRHCTNTGLEPGFGLCDAPACSECLGSPFEQNPTS